jgi:hypothetical protein
MLAIKEQHYSASDAAEGLWYDGAVRADGTIDVWGLIEDAAGDCGLRDR